MHTLNERVMVIPGGTAADVFELLVAAVAEITGWTRSGTTIYIDTARTCYLTFTLSSNNAQIAAFFNSGIALSSATSISLTSNIRIRSQKSTNETVTYLCIGDTTALTFLYAENENGEGVFFRGYATSYMYVGSNTNTAAAYIYTPTDTSGFRKYSVAKYVDFLSSTGGEFSELYWVYSTVNPTAYNQLVDFSGIIMRLITMANAATAITFAVPVSDEVEPEPDPDPEPETTE